MTRVEDSLRTLASGLGDPSRDKAASVYYTNTFIGDDQLLAMYLNSALARKIVNIPAADSVRKGRDWQAKPNQIEKIEAEEKRLGYWPKVLEARIKSRLWGGAAIYYGIKDQDPAEPLEIDRVKRGGIEYLTVMTRRECTAGEIDRNVLSSTYGKPKYYQVNGGDVLAEIHPSRLAVFVGDPHPDPWLSYGVTSGWGSSVLQTVLTELNNTNATAANIASLVFEANVDIFRIPELMRGLESAEFESLLKERVQLAAAIKGTTRALVMDKDEEYDRKQIAFSNLPEVLQEFCTLLAAAADIPTTRLFGRSPAGMNATGEHDMKNYHDRLQSAQTLEITPATHNLDECLIRSALGSRDASIFYGWAPLEQMSEKELAEIGKAVAETVKIYTETGLFPAPVLAKAAANRIVEDSLFPGFEGALEEFGDVPPQDVGATVPDDEDSDAVGNTDVTTDQRFADATPRTLYVRRDVLNVSTIKRWAKGQGLTPQDGLHVTIAYSRTPVDWMKIREPWDAELRIVPGGARVMELFGEGRAVVLSFRSNELEWRHEVMTEAGASWDHDGYQPHMTIAWLAEGETIDLDAIEPYRGEIVLGPEIFEEINDG